MAYDFDMSAAQDDVERLIDRFGDVGARRLLNRRWRAARRQARARASDVLAALQGSGICLRLA
jgi:hypothetical protein